MLFDISMIFVFLLVGAGFVLVALVMGYFIRPRSSTSKAKLVTYECGEEPLGQGWYNFNPRFYLMALVFLIFDVELVITFPAIAVLRESADQGWGLIAFLEIFIFVLILVTGLVFLWVKGDLEWIKQIENPERGD